MSSKLDELLLAKINNDTIIVETLVDEFYGYIYRLAVSILQDHQAAEDIAQETVLTAYLKLDQYEVGSNLKSWLSTIVVNKCRNQIRKQKRRALRHKIWQAGQDEPSASPEMHALQTETHSALWEAINQLGEKHRLPIILRYVHNLSALEIAATLEIKPGTVHSRLHYATHKLKAILAGESLAVTDIWEALP